MKFTSIALITIVGSAAANSVIIQEDAPAFADVPVSVSVFCNGKIDWTKLSLPQSSAIGKILVESYNNVHEKLNNDDSTLRNLIFRSERSLQVDDETQLDAWFKPKVSTGKSKTQSILYTFIFTFTFLRKDTSTQCHESIPFYSMRQERGRVCGGARNARMMTLQMSAAQS